MVHCMQKKNERLQVRLDQEEAAQLNYWSEKMNLTKTAFLRQAMQFYIRYLHNDYDLPTAEIQRLNQMVDAVTMLVQSQMTLEHTVRQTMSNFHQAFLSDQSPKEVPTYETLNNHESLNDLLMNLNQSLPQKENESDKVLSDEIQSLNKIKFKRKKVG